MFLQLARSVNNHRDRTIGVAILVTALVSAPLCPESGVWRMDRKAEWKSWSEVECSVEDAEWM